MSAPSRAPVLNQLTVLLQVPCEAFDKGLQLERGTPRLFVVDECGRHTDKGNFCEQHAVELLGVRVRASDIAGAGDGLFAAGRSFKRGDVICEYLGVRMSKAAFDANPSAYGAELYDRSVIDARWSTAGFGRWANAATRKQDVNAQLISEAKVARKGSGRRLFLQATKAIADEDEILLSYGKTYFANNPLPRGMRAV